VHPDDNDWLHIIGLILKRKELLFKELESLTCPWGWKDPRNTFTFDIWKEIFPSAKVIHIYRNPVDVISSLQKREASRMPTGPIHSRTGIKKTFYSRKLPGKRLFHHSFRSQDNMSSFRLWKEYTTKATSIVSDDKTESIQISYEGLLEKPGGVLKQLADFCDLDYNKLIIEKILASIDTSRKFAFISNKDLVEFYNKIKEDKLVESLDYGNIL